MDKKILANVINIAYELLDDDYFLLTEELEKDKDFLNALREFSIKELVELFDEDIIALYIKYNKEDVIKNKEEWYKELENKDLFIWIDDEELKELGLDLNEELRISDYLKAISK